ncbi:hypothetical protein [Roseibium album]|uniref:hypothetical protein n=1 Tax=Roseibium album TaxID=311410 RepID=UPI00248FEE9A|nr:hypothetical protein [Roseibium album]
MTVSALANTRAQILGDGVTNSVTIPFQFTDQSDLKVIHTDKLGVDTEWNYQQSPGNWSYSGGNLAPGTVHFNGADVSPDERLTIVLTSKYDQTLTLDGGEIDPAVLEKGMDRTALQVQAIAGEVSRALRVSPSLEGNLPDLEVPDLPDGYGIVRQGDELVPALIDSAAISTAVTAAQSAKSLAEAAMIGAETAQTEAGASASSAFNSETVASSSASSAAFSATAAASAKNAAEQAVIDAATNATSVLGYGRIPVGAAMPWPSDQAPNSFWVVVKDVGQTFLRASFPQLLDVYAPERSVVLSNGSPIVTGIGSDQGLAVGMPVEGTGIPANTTIQSVDGPDQVTLSSSAFANGSTCRVFRHGNGNGSTTANFPDFAGRYVRGWDPSGAINPDANGTLGSVQDDAIQNISGEFSSSLARTDHSLNTATGAFEILTGTRSNYVTRTSATGTSAVGASFDASRVARTSNETRPKSVVTAWIVKVADGIDDPSVLTAVSVIQDLGVVSSKVDVWETSLATTSDRMLGVNQEWQDLVSQRVLNTDYQNTDGGPIAISVPQQGSGSTAIFQGFILYSGKNPSSYMEISRSANNTFSGDGVNAVIPDGWYYKVAAVNGETLHAWLELRKVA